MGKQEKKLIQLNEQANECLSREEARKIIDKATKTYAKLMVKRLLNNE